MFIELKLNPKKLLELGCIINIYHSWNQKTSEDRTIFSSFVRSFEGRNIKKKVLFYLCLKFQAVIKISNSLSFVKWIEKSFETPSRATKIKLQDNCSFSQCYYFTCVWFRSEPEIGFNLKVCSIKLIHNKLITEKLIAPPHFIISKWMQDHLQHSGQISKN